MDGERRTADGERYESEQRRKSDERRKYDDRLYEEKRRAADDQRRAVEDRRKEDERRKEKERRQEEEREACAAMEAAEKRRKLDKQRRAAEERRDVEDRESVENDDRWKERHNDEQRRAAEYLENAERRRRDEQRPFMPFSSRIASNPAQSASNLRMAPNSAASCSRMAPNSAASNSRMPHNSTSTSAPNARIPSNSASTSAPYGKDVLHDKYYAERAQQRSSAQQHRSASNFGDLPTRKRSTTKALVNYDIKKTDTLLQNMCIFCDEVHQKAFNTLMAHFETESCTFLENLKTNGRWLTRAYNSSPGDMELICDLCPSQPKPLKNKSHAEYIRHQLDCHPDRFIPCSICSAEVSVQNLQAHKYAHFAGFVHNVSLRCHKPCCASAQLTALEFLDHLPSHKVKINGVSRPTLAKYVVEHDKLSRTYGFVAVKFLEQNLRKLPTQDCDFKPFPESV